jgi:hypothetical protein
VQAELGRKRRYETDDSETETEERLDTARSALVALRKERAALKKELAVAMMVGAAETAAAKKERALAVAEARKAGVVNKKEGSAALSAASLKGAAQLAEAKKTLSPHQWLLPRVPLQTLTNSTAWLPF